MKNIRIIFILLFGMYSCFFIPVEAVVYRFGHLTTNDGLSDNQVNCIMKDSKGFLWFGNKNGLNRYDGTKIKIYQHDKYDSTSIPENFVVSIQEALDGRLWITTLNGLVIFDTQRELFVRNVQAELASIGVTDKIHLLYIDSQKNSWMASGNNLYKYDAHHQKTTHIFLDKKLYKRYGKINSIFAADHRVWLQFRNGLIYELDQRNFRLIGRYDYVSKQISINRNLELKVFVDTDHDIWVYGFRAGLFHYKRKQKEWEQLKMRKGSTPLSSDIVNYVTQDKSGLIWIATDQGGVNVLNKNKNEINYIFQDKDSKFGLSHNSIQWIYIDDLGIVWLGTFKEGLNYYHKNIFKFKLLKHDKNEPKTLPFDDVNCFVEDRDGNLWMGTNGGGLIVKDKKNGKYTQYRSGSTPGLLSNVIVALRRDAMGQIWIGTYNGGLSCYDGKRFRNYTHDEKDQNTVSNNNIWDVVFEPNGTMWVATLGDGVDAFDPKMNKTAHFEMATGGLQDDYILSLTMDYPHLIVVSDNGLDTYNIQDKKFDNHFFSETSKESTETSHINFIFKDSRGLYWAGSSEGLTCFDIQNHKTYHYTEKDGIPNNMIQTMVEDEKHNLWCSTIKGVFCTVVSRENQQVNAKFIAYNEKDGLQMASFNYKSAIRTSDNQIYFGGADGINYFGLKEINNSSQECNVVFTDLQIYNNSIRPQIPYNGRVILDKNIATTDKIVLSYNDNFLSIEFSALNYFMSRVTNYYYKLEGFNSQWLKTSGNTNAATYTNLSPGTYTFMVRASLNGGRLSSKTASITIVILPPWWLSGWAWSVYFLILIFGIFYARHLIIQKHNLKLAYSQEKMEAEKMHIFDEMKLKFFTNISHEFRTPLTLILAPLEKLIAQNKDINTREQLEMMQRNAKQLLSLVNQVLDFRKLEKAGYELVCSQGDVIGFVRDLFSSFSEVFERKQIRSGFSSPVTTLLVNFDSDKLSKIIINILSNALKFTSEEGEIKLSISVNIPPKSKNAVIRIEISDTGIGIPEEYVDKIFERFYQVPRSTPSAQGSGIGLHLVKEFVQLMNGKIEVNSKVGVGTVFSIELPFELIESSYDTTPKQQPFEEVAQDVVLMHEDSVFPLILIVEDNDDLRIMLKNNFRETCRVLEASNGAKGLEMALNELPDLIISDLMMPEMDGLEMSRALKSDLRTSHIPILMLTAKTADETRLASLEIGIEDYITKPFNLEALMLKVRNIAQRRQNVQKNFQQKMEILPGEIQITSMDEKLIQKAISLVEEHISDGEFSVEELSRLLGMSRTNLYKKLQSITGKSPIEFIRIIRLKRSLQLLQKSQMSIAEIAFEVGFNTPRYFSKYFKEEYNITPSAYVESLKKGDSAKLEIEGGDV